MGVRISPAGAAIDALIATEATTDEGEAVESWLKRADEVDVEVRHLEDRVLGFFKPRALEADPDRQVFGAAMRARVLEACELVEALVGRLSELEPVCARMRAAHAFRLAAAAAAAEETRRQAATREAAAAAARAAAAAEEAAALARAEEAAAAVRASAARDAVARALAQSISERSSAERADALVEAPMDDGLAAEVLAAYAGPPLSVEGTLELLRANDVGAYADAVQVACLLLSNIHRFPEELSFRALRLRNQLIHSHLALRPGGLRLLRALGFLLRDGETDEPSVVLVEPHVETAFEEWAAWFETLKANIASLEAVLRALRVPVLPTTMRGAQYSADTPSSGRRRADPQVMTLRGNSGGAS
jgi:hypothetical protein